MQAHAIILRAPQRASATVAALSSRGITSSCVQLIETVWPAELTELDAQLELLVSAAYDWTVFTSVSTVQVLASRLAQRRIPERTRIAAVGAKTAQAVQDLLHRPVDFVPQIQSAAGMVQEWVLPTGTKLFYPHGDLAAPTLAQGMLRQGIQLTEVIAYQTVSAGSPGTPVAPAQLPEGLTVLKPEQLRTALEATDLVIFAAPSIVRRFVELVGSQLPPRVHTLAIGEPTAQALRNHALPVHGVAADPTPKALALRAEELIQTPTQNR